MKRNGIYYVAPDGFRSQMMWRVLRHINGDRFPRKKNR